MTEVPLKNFLARVERASLTPEVLEKARIKFQLLGETGISADYFNDMILFSDIHLKRILHPEIRLKRFEYQTSEETNAKFAEIVASIREDVAERLPKLLPYSEWVERVREDVPREIFINEKNAARVVEMDEKIRAMQAAFSDNPEDIDLSKVNKLAFEVACLIYGKEYEEDLRKRFLELH